MVLVYYYIAILYLITFSSGEGYYTKHLGNYFVFIFAFIYFFCLSIGFRGSRESLHSGMTYNARRGSNASIYQEGDYLFIFSLFFSLILFLFFLLILPLLPFRYCFFFLLFSLFFQKTKIHSDDDYYYGGSMRDLSSRRGNRRKSSSASHIGKNTKPRKLIKLIS